MEQLGGVEDNHQHTGHNGGALAVETEVQHGEPPPLPHPGLPHSHPHQPLQPPTQHPGSNLSSPHPPVSSSGPAVTGETVPQPLGPGPHPPGSLTGPPPLLAVGPQRFPTDPRQQYNAEQMAAVLPLMDTFSAIHNMGNYYY